MDIFELINNMYENKELHCRKKNLYSLKVRIKIYMNHAYMQNIKHIMIQSGNVNTRPEEKHYITIFWHCQMQD